MIRSNYVRTKMKHPIFIFSFFFQIPILALPLLPTAFPDIPAGLRGEAVRNAIRKELGVGNNNLNNGRGILLPLHTSTQLVKLHGLGVSSFVQGKFTCSAFSSSSLSVLSHASSSSNSSSSSSSMDSGVENSIVYKDCDVKDACWLTNKGKVVDTLKIAYFGSLQEAYLLTSYCTDSNSSASSSSSSHSKFPYNMYDLLNKTVFPLDQVTLTDLTKSARVFGVIAPDEVVAKRILQRSNIVDSEAIDMFLSRANVKCLKSPGGCILMKGMQLFNYKHCYTMIVPDNDEGDQIFHRITEHIGNGDKDMPPLIIDASEYESLRIEYGIPSTVYEMVGYEKDSSGSTTSAGPLELNLSQLIDTEKGCYLGQEAVNAQAKNPRGPPRKLYSIIFPDENEVDDELEDDDDFTFLPDNNDIDIDDVVEVGDEIYLLGSNETVQVGHITSVAEPGSTGDAATVALALVKRSDTILKQQAELGLDTEDWIEADDDGTEDKFVTERENILLNDPLHRLEVVIKGKWLHGRLHALKPLGSKIDDSEKYVINEENKSEAKNENSEEDDDEEEVARMLVEAERAALEAAEEAKRKAAKLEMLRKRAEEAMKARKEKRQSLE